MFDDIPWYVFAALALLGSGVAGGATFYFTRNWKLALGVAFAVGAPMALKTIKQKGYNEGAADTKKKVEKENAKVLKESQAIEKKSRQRTPAERRKRGGRFVHDG